MIVTRLGSKKISPPDGFIVQRRGLGDTIEDINRRLGVTSIVKKVSSAMGIEDCGCDKRRDALNRMFPYDTNK